MSDYDGGAGGGAELVEKQVPIWIGQHLAPDNPLYNMAFAFHLRGEIDGAVLARAWGDVVDACRVLRTGCVERNGAPVRTFLPKGSGVFEFVDLSNSPDAEQAWGRLGDERSREVFPLGGPLAASALVKLDDSHHIWFLNQHHLITDAWSTVLVFRAVERRYREILEGGEGRAPSIPDYDEVVESVKEVTAGSIDGGVRQHWQERASGEGRAFAFYGDSRQPTNNRTRRVSRRLDRDRSDRIREIRDQPGFLSLTPQISEFAVFATVLVAWLNRITGHAGQVGFDTPVQCRPTPQAKECPGLFIEMFPFSVELLEGDTFRELGERCLAETQLLLRNAMPGAGEGIESTPGSVVLNYFSGTFGDFAGQEVDVDWLHPGHGDQVHTVRLQVHDFQDSGEFTLQFDLNEEVFGGEVAERAVSHFFALLDAFLEDVDAAISTVDVLTDGERRRILEDYNATAEREPPSGTVIDRFDKCSERYRDDVALVEGGRRLTYGQLQELVGSIATELVGHGARSGDVVALYMRRSIESVASVLAILRLGAAFVPIDPRYPKLRGRRLFEASGARLALVDDEDAAAAVVPHGLTTFDPRRCSQGGAPPPGGPAADDLAYVIFTSGSTGHPKGVEVDHLGLINYLDWASRMYVRGDRLEFALFTSLSFDLTITCLFLPLITGGTMHIYEGADSQADGAFMDVVRDNAVDFIKLTPSHLSLLERHDLSESRLRRIVVGGEDFKTRVAAAIDARLDGAAEIFNEYGPTEAVVGCMIHRYDAQADTGGSVPIGRPADGTHLYVLNGALTPVPEGVPGELCVSRAGLARGYRDNPEESARRFVANPFLEGVRLYRTGDLVRFGAAGEMQFLGRADHQLKVSGHRVEPGEIEAAMMSHPGVSASAVKGRAVAGASPRAVAVERHCRRCGLPSNYPGARFDASGLCSICTDYDSIKDHAQEYFGDLDELLEQIGGGAEGGPERRYDCLALLSGGKDSTYALCRLVDLGLKVYAFSFDNGYISDQAKENIRSVVDKLGVDHEFASTPAINAIFKDSLTRHSNVCNGCFKTIYTLAVNRAVERDIPVIVTGLSRGQLFETRLTPNLFKGGRCSPAEIDAAVLAARKAYHRLDDEVARSLPVDVFRDDSLFERIRFVDFYRYCDVSLTEVMRYLKERVAWERPSDTGRSTNCRVNDVGIYIHQKERGFHNYGLPYSWDVLMGHKKREEAIRELDDELDLSQVREMLAEIGYDEDRLSSEGGRAELVGYYVASEGGLSEGELRRHLLDSLPESLVPTHLVEVDSIPLTEHGKADLSSLPDPVGPRHGVARPAILPEGAAEEEVANIWGEALGVTDVGALENFFQLGGTSLMGMDVMWKVGEHFQVELPLDTLFVNPTVRSLASAVEAKLLEEIEALSEDEAQRLAGEGSA